MNRAAFLVVPIVFMANIFLIAAGCNQGNGVAGGGDMTADFFNEVEAMKMKMAACAPDQEIFDWGPGVNTLPILDGLSATLAEELYATIRYANSAVSCDQFFVSLNSELPVQTCDQPGRKCKGAVAMVCLAGATRNYRIDIDCGDMDLGCLDGVCTIGVCDSGECDRDTLVTCDRAGLKKEFRCGRLGLACGYADNALQCIGEGEQCSITSVAPACQGNVLNFCLGGRQANIDCEKISGGRRECNQSWLDANQEITPLEIVTSFLDRVCSQKYAECQDGASICSEDDEALFCRDGLYENVYCPYFGFEGCTPPGPGVEKATCSGFVEILE